MKTSILILDGDRWQRETLAAALAYEGCHAEHTGDAASAMAMLARHRWQLVLIDPSAPATGGWKTIKQLLLLYPTLRMILLVSDEAEPHSTLIAGRMSMVGKPVEFSSLLRAINDALSNQTGSDSGSSLEQESSPTSHAAALKQDQGSS